MSRTRATRNRRRNAGTGHYHSDCDMFYILLQRETCLSISLSRLVMSLQTLRNFSSACILLSPPALGHIAMLPKLTSLEIGIPMDEGFIGDLPYAAFSSLSEIVLWATNIQQILPLVEAVFSSVLASLVLNVEKTPQLQDLSRLFRLLACRRPLLPLSRFYGFQVNQAPRDLIDVQIFDVEILTSLLDFPGVEYFWMNCYLSLESVDNAVISRLSQAWTSLRELDLGSISCCGPVSRINLAGLLIFAQYCPLLEVRVSMDNKTISNDR